MESAFELIIAIIACLSLFISVANSFIIRQVIWLGRETAEVMSEGFNLNHSIHDSTIGRLKTLEDFVNEANAREKA